MNFKQKLNEPLHCSWERFTDALFSCPEHKLNEHEQLRIFYQGLDAEMRFKVDFKRLIPRMTSTKGMEDIKELYVHSLSWKDHFPLPFIDQMLERLSGNEYYCFLDGFSGYFHIPLAPKDQVKTTFTYKTFAYRRMPFGQSNALATFQRCMTAIFHDMCKDFMKVFMDDFFVFGNSFDYCLTNLSKMLARDKKVTENLVADYLSILENPDMETLNEDAIQDSFPDEHLMAVQVRETAEDPWNRKEWADKLDDVLWAFMTAYKSPIRSTPFRIVYGKACHLSIEIEHKAYWAYKTVNLDLDTASKHRSRYKEVEFEISSTRFHVVARFCLGVTTLVTL
nr:RNA-directed DNA polymerase homolog [Tanacetum cinerariifolium]